MRDIYGRSDFAIIGELVEPRTRVLDLGCGEGELLAWLKEHKDVDARGVEMTASRVQKGIARGVSVYQGDLESALDDYPDQAFDFVILSQTLQETRYPLRVLRSMLRVGRRGIVAFPNYGHYKMRLSHLFGGRAPKTELFPHDWFDSPNIHFLTVLDFDALAEREGWTLERKIFLSGRKQVTMIPNLTAQIAVFLLSSAHPQGTATVRKRAMTFQAPPTASGDRLDHYLQQVLPHYSRARLQSWIKDGHVRVNGAPAKASLTLRGGEQIEVEPADLPPLKATPEDLPVEILYEDESVLAVNKPAGVVVHAGAGNHEGTLVNRLVHRFQSLSHVGGDLRPGIVHRLDKETSGVLLVARTDAAHRALAAQFAARTIDKIYLALVQGLVASDTGRVTKPIARDPVRRTRMTARLATGREAITQFRVLQRFEKFTYLEVKIGTGRTHQIRVHLASLGHPVAGDTLYGARPAPRMFLHAHQISFTTPADNTRITVQAPLPEILETWHKKLV